MLLTVDGVSKRYRVRKAEPVLANQDISFEVDAGEVFGLLGHNGAGKTTLVDQIVGAVVPDAGRIIVDGHDATAEPALARSIISLQPQATVPLNGLTPRQAVDIVGRLRGGSRTEVRNRIGALLEALDIAEWADVMGQRLSGGVRRLTGFCLAAVVPGRIVVLDEPTNDVDPVRRRLLWQQIRLLADAGHAVLLVTHNVAEVERAVDRLVVLEHGRVAASGTVGELKSGISDELRLELVVAAGSDPPRSPSFATGAGQEGRRMLMRVGLADSDRAIRWARELSESKRIDEFAIRPVSLEDVYVSLSNGGGQARELSDADE